MLPKSFLVTIEVGSCRECPYLRSNYYEGYCQYSSSFTNDKSSYLYHENKDEITESCPAWDSTQPKP